MSPDGVRFRRSSTILTRSFGQDVLLALPHSDEIEILSGTASYIWRLLAEPRTADEVVTRMTDRFTGAPIVIRRDVDDLLRHLQRAGYIEKMAE